MSATSLSTSVPCGTSAPVPRQFERFRTLALVGVPVEVALGQIGAPRHVQDFVAHTRRWPIRVRPKRCWRPSSTAAKTSSQRCSRRLLNTLYDAKHDNDRLRHFIYYIDRHIELDGDSHGPKGRELLEDLLANSPRREERARRATYSSIKARAGLWNGTLSKLRNSRGGERSVENQAA
jgi:hypothetical protein